MFVRPTAGGAVLPLKQERRFSDLAPGSSSDLQITASLLKEEGETSAVHVGQQRKTTQGQDPVAGCVKPV